MDVCSVCTVLSSGAAGQSSTIPWGGFPIEGICCLMDGLVYKGLIPLNGTACDVTAFMGTGDHCFWGVTMANSERCVSAWEKAHALVRTLVIVCLVSPSEVAPKHVMVRFSTNFHIIDEPDRISYPAVLFTAFWGPGYMGLVPNSIYSAPISTTRR